MNKLSERLDALSPEKRALLARKLGDRQAGVSTSIPTVPRGARGYPLSFAQERMWFLQRASPESSAYNLGIYFRASFDPAAFRQALGLVVARHEAWRTSFHLVEGTVEQRVHPPCEVSAPVLPLEPGLTEAEQLDRQARRLMEEPFDLSRGPLYRFAFLESDRPEVHTFIAVFHHIIFDSYSVGVFLAEATRTYLTLRGGARPDMPPLPIQTIDHAAWERKTGPQRWARQLERWRARLEGAPELLELATDRPRLPRSSGRGGSVPLRLDPGLVRDLRETGARAGATLFSVLLAGFQVILSRHSGQEDVVVGIPVANRGGDPELRNLLGLFVNTVPLRSDLSGAPTFAALLRQVAELSREALANAEVPLGLLCEELRVARAADRHPLFQVLFDLQLGMTLPENLGLPAEALGQIVPEGSAKFDLCLVLSQEAGSEGSSGALVGRLEYSADLYDGETVAEMARQLLSLLRSAATDPDQPIRRLPLMDEATRAQVLERRGISPHPPPEDAGYAATLTGQFEAIARENPDAIAVSMGREADGTRVELSYGELDRRANQLARALVELGAGPGQLVALCMDRSPDLVVGMLGILKAGAAWLPMEVTWPWERMRATLEDARVDIVVTHAELLAAFSDSVKALVALDRVDGELEGGPRVVDGAELDRQPWSPPGPGPRPEDLAYCIYTSGSTGRPKGVLVTHHNVLRLFSASSALFDYSPRDVWSFFHSFTFDFSVWELWGALLHGGRIAVVPFAVSRSPRAFAAWIAEEEVTLLSQTPSALAALVPVLDALPPSLRCVVLGGEAFEPRRFQGFLRQCEGRARVINMYGITETTVHVTWRPVSAADVERGGSPIGDPLPDLRIHLLDPGMEPVPTGVPGEIWVGGPGVARGYLRRPELTAERFVPDPHGEGTLYRSGDLARYRGDGELIYLGRGDQQIKVRGFRVETGEIEAALLSHPQVRDAAVALRKEDGVDTLVAYVVADGTPLSVQALRQHLRRTLTDYMLPNAFVFLEALPLTANGKLDRRALPAPDSSRPAVETGYVAPSGPLEEALAAIWKGVLQVDRVGAQDNFFELGGDSIRGAIMIEEIQRRTGEIVHVALLFDVQTISAIARWLLENCPAGARRLAEGKAAAAPQDGAITLTAGAGITHEDLARFQGLIPSFEAQPARRRNPRAIFILTPPRSGSTLLRVILGGHPGLFSPPELELLGFHTLSERLETFSGRLEHWTEGTVRALMELQGIDADAAFDEEARLAREGMDVPGYYGHLQALAGERILVDKTASYPLDPGVLAAAEAWFEEPLYIHLHRHPVDGVSSFLAARIDQLGLIRQAHDFSREQLAELVYTTSHENILRFLEGVPAERRLRLAYEDLVTDPVGEIQRLCAFIGLPVASGMLDPYADKERRMTDGVRKDAGWTLGDVKFHRYERIEASSAHRWQRAGVRVDLGEPTWEVAETLGYRRPAKRSPLVVPLGGGPEQRPFFCVHPVGGQVFCYRDLARLLAPVCALHGIQAEPFAGVEDPATTIEEMAARYVEALRGVQPEGPYLLGGWSLGGVIAFEMARQLRQQGQEVERLLLIDSAAPADGPAGLAAQEGVLGEVEDPMEAYLGLDLAALGGEQLPEMIEALRHMAIEARQDWIAERARRSDPFQRMGEAQKAVLAKVFRINREAVARYRAGSFDGELRLYRAARQLSPGPGAEGWSALAPALRSARVPGHHYSILQPPYVEELARCIVAELEHTRHG